MSGRLSTRRRAPGPGVGQALLVLALAVGCATPDERPGGVPEGPAIEVTARIEPALATIGDRVDYVIEVERRVDLEVPQPSVEVPSGLTLVDSGSDTARAGRGRARDRFWYRLRADRVGSFVLPPVAVPARTGSADLDDERSAEAPTSTPEVFLEVRSVLPADGEVADIRDIKPIEPPPAASWQRWLAGLAATVAAAALLLWLWRRWRAVTRERLMPLPHETAMTALRALRQRRPREVAALHGWTFELSEVVRGYVEARFGVNATDLTTEELLPRLERAESLSSDWLERLERFLVDTDRVKYADEASSTERADAAWLEAAAFVEDTRPRPENDEEGLTAPRRQEALFAGRQRS